VTAIQPDPQLVREIVRSAIGYVTRDSVRCRLVQAAIAEHGVDEHNLPTWSAYYDAAIAALDDTRATGVWPDEEAQNGPDVDPAYHTWLTRQLRHAHATGWLDHGEAVIQAVRLGRDAREEAGKAFVTAWDRILDKADARTTDGGAS
jgi:hypothetical protein